jgi:hypothetical protein
MTGSTWLADKAHRRSAEIYATMVAYLWARSLVYKCIYDPIYMQLFVTIFGPLRSRLPRVRDAGLDAFILQSLVTA